MGFVLRNLSFALALFKSADPATDRSSYYAVKRQRWRGDRRRGRHHDPANLLGIEVSGGKNNAGRRRESLDLAARVSPPPAVSW